MAWEAQKRLYQKHGRMRIRAKSHQVTVTAMSRELAGFVWAVGRQRETEMNKEGLPVERLKEAGKHPHGKDKTRNIYAIGTAVPNSRHWSERTPDG